MKNVYFTLFVFVGAFSNAQINGVVIDSVSNKEIPYVNIWVEDENIGITSDENGEFQFKKINKNETKRLIFSALGYEIKKISFLEIKDTVLLNQKPLLLEEIILAKKRNDKELVVGKFKKSKINFYYGSGEKPWMVGRIFPHEDRFEKTPFLKSLKIHTKSRINNAKFNIRIYKKGKNLEPIEELHDENIIAFVKKGNKLTEIDVSGLDIIIPKEGIVIIVEWLIIETNKREYTVTYKKENKKIDMVSYEPRIGTLPAENGNNSLIYMKGKWMNAYKIPESSIKKYREKYNLLAIELTLTN